MVDVISTVINDISETLENESLLEFVRLMIIILPFLGYILPKIGKIFIEGTAELPVERITLTKYQKFKEFINLALFGVLYFSVIFYVLSGDIANLEMIFLVIILVIGAFLVVLIPSYLLTVKYKYFIEESEGKYEFMFKRDNYYLLKKVSEDYSEDYVKFVEEIKDKKISYELEKLNCIQLLIKSHEGKKLNRINRILILMGILLFSISFIWNIWVVLICMFLMIMNFVSSYYQKKFLKNIKAYESNRPQ